MLELTDDRGVITVLTAIVSSVVLFAGAAIAVDVAALYSERRQLQNGADAAAIAIAQSCARGLVNAAPCDTSLASALADG
ncbi:MAG TPA: pilus assembly protein TadG-related protein, partial [Pseudonocardiaceae bacterium]